MKKHTVNAETFRYNSILKKVKQKKEGRKYQEVVYYWFVEMRKRKSRAV